LRPAFVLRVISRFQKIAGFDRSMALASGALTALIPLAVLGGAVFGGEAADRIINRYGLTGEGAEAVRAVFSAGTTSAGVGVFGTVFLAISVLSFSRTMQRLFEQTWELKPLGVRNTRNGLWWICTLSFYSALIGWLYVTVSGGRLGLAAAVCEVPVTAAFLAWSGWILSAKRLAGVVLLPFAICAGALTAAYSVVATVYLPRLFNSYAARYGAAGAVFGMASVLFGAMLVLVLSAALGREVRDDLVRIRQGRRPSQDEVRSQWDSIVEQSRSRWRTVRNQPPHPQSENSHRR
jgi:membrane protein